MDYNKVTVIDKLLAKTLLRFIPETVTPNQVTYLRFILTPVVGWLFYKEIYDWGLVLFLLTMLTDAIDGAMARTRNQITDLGKMIDPLADKLIIGVVAILLIAKFLSLRLAVLLVVLDVLAMLVGAYRKYILNRVVQAEIFGKLKVIMQVAGIVILLLYILLSWSWLLLLARHTLYVAIGLILISSLRAHSI